MRFPHSRDRRLMKTSLIGFCLAVSAFTGGCTARTFPEDVARQPAGKAEEQFRNLQSLVRRDGTVVGYVETQETRPKGAVDRSLRYVVHTPAFDPMGIVTSTGGTYRYHGGDLERLGDFELAEGARRILRIEEDVQLRQVRSGR